MDNVNVLGVAAILTKKGNIFTGVCFDKACSLGLCAERNAIGNMLTNGEVEITKLVSIGTINDDLMMPCDVCQELMLHLSNNNKNLQILVNLEDKRSIRLEELMSK